jgi:hypothetical protein
VWALALQEQFNDPLANKTMQHRSEIEQQPNMNFIEPSF